VAEITRADFVGCYACITKNGQGANALAGFFAHLMRAHSFRASARKAAETKLGIGPGRPNTMNAETQNALTLTSTNLVPVSDGWDAAANDASASHAKGGSIKFDAGAYFIGREKTLVEESRQFVAIDIREGWMFLKKDCPAEFAMRPIGGPKPARPDSFTNSSEWPPGSADPWRYSKFLYLLDPATAEVFTFTSSTTGGRIGISDLTAQIQLMRSTRPGAVPIVELQSRGMKTKFGMKPRPFFQVVGWRVKSDEATKLIAEHTDKAEDDDGKTVNLFDDEIPFN
jgi:hypothetical protein